MNPHKFIIGVKGATVYTSLLPTLNTAIVSSCITRQLPDARYLRIPPCYQSKIRGRTVTFWLILPFYLDSNTFSARQPNIDEIIFVVIS